jgi:proton-dependent oligopeptide transporter, POT family
VNGLQPGVKVSMFWLTSLYVIHTLGELCLSPIGLSMVNKLAPVKFASLLMGVWFMSTSAANKFAGDLSALYPEPIVAITTLEKREQDSGLTLFPAGYDKGARKVGETAVIPMERIALDNIKDEAQKTQVKKTIESSLVDNPKFFLGIKIANLYDFFLLFVGMSGLSAVILLILSRKLLGMMHGVR